MVQSRRVKGAGSARPESAPSPLLPLIENRPTVMRYLPDGDVVVTVGGRGGERGSVATAARSSCPRSDRPAAGWRSGSWSMRLRVCGVGRWRGEYERSCKPWPFLPWRASVPLERTVPLSPAPRHGRVEPPTGTSIARD